MSKTDLDFLAKAFEEGLDGGEVAEAFAWREVVGEDDLLEVGLAQGVEIEMPGKLSSQPAVGILDAALLPAGPEWRSGASQNHVVMPLTPESQGGEQSVARQFAAPPRPPGLGSFKNGAACLLARFVEGDRVLQLRCQSLEIAMSVAAVSAALLPASLPWILGRQGEPRGALVQHQDGLGAPGEHQIGLPIANLFAALDRFGPVVDRHLACRIWRSP